MTVTPYPFIRLSIFCCCYGFKISQLTLLRKQIKEKKGACSHKREREQETARLKLRLFHCLFSQGEQKKIEESKAVSV